MVANTLTEVPAKSLETTGLPRHSIHFGVSRGPEELILRSVG
jgi:hypothetical protein